jgi:small subunit ribosomal protein S21
VSVQIEQYLSVNFGERVFQHGLYQLIQRSVLVVKLRLRDGEKIQDAVKRFRKLVEHAGIKKEMRRREYYEKPSDTDRRNRRRAERRARLARLIAR